MFVGGSMCTSLLMCKEFTFDAYSQVLTFGRQRGLEFLEHRLQLATGSSLRLGVQEGPTSVPTHTVIPHIYNIYCNKETHRKY